MNPVPWVCSSVLTLWPIVYVATINQSMDSDCVGEAQPFDFRHSSTLAAVDEQWCSRVVPGVAGWRQWFFDGSPLYEVGLVDSDHFQRWRQRIESGVLVQFRVLLTWFLVGKPCKTTVNWTTSPDSIVLCLRSADVVLTSPVDLDRYNHSGSRPEDVFRAILDVAGMFCQWILLVWGWPKRFGPLDTLDIGPKDH